MESAPIFGTVHGLLFALCVDLNQRVLFDIIEDHSLLIH